MSSKGIQVATRSRPSLVIDGSAATTALAAPVPVTTRPTTGVIGAGSAPLMRFIFGVTDADGETVNYQVIGWYLCRMPAGVADTWIGVVLAKGTVTAGTLAITGITGGLFADTITDSVSTQTSLISTLANHVAMLTVDTHNAALIQVVTDLGTAAKAYVWNMPGEFGR